MRVTDRTRLAFENAAFGLLKFMFEDELICVRSTKQKLIFKYGGDIIIVIPKKKIRKVIQGLNNNPCQP